jgi:hypothetical protein
VQYMDHHLRQHRRSSFLSLHGQAPVCPRSAELRKRWRGVPKDLVFNRVLIRW